MHQPGLCTPSDLEHALGDAESVCSPVVATLVIEVCLVHLNCSMGLHGNNMNDIVCTVLSLCFGE